MSVQKKQLAREAMENLKLRAAIQSTNYEVTGEGNFFKSSDWQEQEKNQREWDALKAEEFAEVEAQRKNQPAFKTMSQLWSKPIAELRQSVRLPDVACQLPLSTKSTADVPPSLVDNFVDLQKSRGVVYSKDGFLRLSLYLATMNQTSQVIDGVTYYVALDTLDCWLAADRRLVELGAFSDTERASLIDEPEPATAELSANDLLREANAGWFMTFSQTWDAWLASLAQDPWNFHPNENQKIAAIKMLQQFGTTPDSWDRTRRCLGRSGVWPNLATADEVLAEKVEAGEFRLDTEVGRRAYMIAHNQVTYGTLNE